MITKLHRGGDKKKKKKRKRRDPELENNGTEAEAVEPDAMKDTESITRKRKKRKQKDVQLED